MGRWPFHPEQGEDRTLEDDHLAKMMELTGQAFPTKMLERAKLRNEYFDGGGMSLHYSVAVPDEIFMAQETSYTFRS